MSASRCFETLNWGEQQSKHGSGPMIRLEANGSIGRLEALVCFMKKTTADLSF